jgi:putative Mg2+ transporter-C (MgtC) family protein
VILALAATLGHFIVVLVYPSLAASLPRSRYVGFALRIVYADGRGILRRVLAESTRLGYAIRSVDTRQLEHDIDGTPAVAVTLAFKVSR